MDESVASTGDNGQDLRAEPDRARRADRERAPGGPQRAARWRYATAVQAARAVNAAGVRSMWLEGT